MALSAPAYEGRGIGVSLLDQTIKCADARGFDYVAGQVELELHRALIERSLVPASSTPR